MVSEFMQMIRKIYYVFKKFKDEVYLIPLLSAFIPQH